MKVLVVDDSSPIRMILNRMLRDMGYAVLEATHGKEALAQLDANPDIRLILLDWNMPEMNGIEFLEAIQGRFEGKERPRIIMVTTENEMDKIIQATSKGANEYIMKPFTKEILEEKLTILGIREGTHA